MKYGADVARMYCCGTREIGNFRGEDEESQGYYNDGDFEYESTNAKALLSSVRADFKGIVLSIWFVKYKKFDGTHEDKYEYEPLRKLVKKIGGVVHLGETINPNSGNYIDGYSWINK